MQVTINPKYEHLRPLIEGLPTSEAVPEHVFCNERNAVWQQQLGDISVVIKRFKLPTLLNRFVYAYLRPNKGIRAYRNALKLRSMGIDSPEPVACLVQKRHGMVHTVWYVSVFSPARTLHDVYLESQGDEREKLVRSYLAWAKRLLGLGVLQLDNNSRNTLVSREADGSYHFALVDINRMRFVKRVTRKQVYAFFNCIYLNLPETFWLLHQYSEFTDDELLDAMELSVKLRKKRILQRKIKHPQRYRREKAGSR